MVTAPTRELIEEHTGIAVMLGILESIAKRLERREQVPVYDLERILDFLRVFADQCHHGKEEDCYFTDIVKFVPDDLKELVGVLIEEHKQGRVFIESFAQAPEHYKNGADGGAEELINSANDYTILLRQHIEKENSKLFPEVDRVWAASEQEEATFCFAKIDEEKIGKDKITEFHQLLDELTRKYVNQ